ncbi:MAG: radical SAM protein [Planctomycetes bacterium]|nr:radical SAM protein [Planctomycetota bacterium]
MAESLRINEIFHSIQGESTWAGLPCIFVRLTGCHLRCTYCDTEYAFHEGQRQDVQNVVDEVLALPTRLVEVTGGEPLLQAPGVHALMAALCDAGCTVLLETSGACDISVCDPRVIRIMDIKTPGSGEAVRNLWSNIEHLNDRDEVKLVIADREDYEWSVAVMQEHRLAQRVHAVLLSPIHQQPAGLEISGHRGLAAADLAAWMLTDALGSNVRLQIQTHKVIWDPQQRGV